MSKSWQQAPAMTVLNSSPATLYGYDMGSRAYLVDYQSVTHPNETELNIAASTNSPLVNPAILINNWGLDSVIIEVNGSVIPRGPDFRYGFYESHDVEDGREWNDVLVIWLHLESTQAVNLKIRGAGQIPPLPCEDVSSPFSNNIKANSARLNWTGLQVVDHYEIRGQQVGNANMVTLHVSGGTDNLPVGGLSPNSSYYWQIRSHCDSTETLTGYWSAIDTFTTPCSHPANLGAFVQTFTSARLTWSPSNGAIGYQLKGREIGGNFVTIDLNGGGSTALNTGSVLTPGTSYEFKVDAICNSGLHSGFSPLFFFATPIAKRTEESMAELVVTVKPNPSNGHFTVFVHGGTESSANAQVFDMMGRKLLSVTQGVQAEMKLNIQGHEPGIYLLKVFIGGKSSVHKVILE